MIVSNNDVYQQEYIIRASGCQEQKVDVIEDMNIACFLRKKASMPTCTTASLQVGLCRKKLCENRGKSESLVRIGEELLGHQIKMLCV
jgi:hypothetical protein